MQIFGMYLPADNLYFLIVAIFSIVSIAFVIYQAVIWTIFPYSVFGIKPLLRKLIEQQQAIEKLLREGSAPEAAKSDVARKDDNKMAGGA